MNFIVTQHYMGELWSIILAAGESKRMGFPKMLLSFNGKPMLENVIEVITGTSINETLVVLGADKAELLEVVGRLPVKHCFNDNYNEGMLSSVKCGFSNLPYEYDAVMVFQGDQPLISPNTVNMIIQAYRSSGKGIVVPVFKKKRGHPLLIDKKYRDEIEKLDNRKGLRSLANLFPDDVLEVETNDPGIMRDFDTYSDYMKEINQIH
jgi:molybdenum cofactor cytidylyltransferase